jgi:hypothetical protein
MDVTGIIAEIDAQLSKLRQARELLSGSASTPVVRGPGRPKGTKSVTQDPHVSHVVSWTAKHPKRKHKMSGEGRKRISDASKKRWAEKRKAAAK